MYISKEPELLLNLMIDNISVNLYLLKYQVCVTMNRTCISVYSRNSVVRPNSVATVLLALMAIFEMVTALLDPLPIQTDGLTHIIIIISFTKGSLYKGNRLKTNLRLINVYFYSISKQHCNPIRITNIVRLSYSPFVYYSGSH